MRHLHRDLTLPPRFPMLSIARARRALVPILVATLATPALAHAQATAAKRAAAAPSAKVEALVAAMTLEEKVALLRGGVFGGMMGGPKPDAPVGEVGYIAGVPRLGIPGQRHTDGPAGVRIDPSTTAMPAPVSLASTFSADLAARYGRVLGQESRAFGQDVVYGPMLNIVRVPQAGRNFETLGEDPALMTKLGVAQVKAIQAEGVIAATSASTFAPGAAAARVAGAACAWAIAGVASAAARMGTSARRARAMLSMGSRVGG